MMGRNAWFIRMAGCLLAAFPVLTLTGCLEDAPTAFDLTLSTEANTPVSASLPGTVPNGPIAFSVVTDGSMGHAVIDPKTGTVTYTPDPDVTGIDRFTFKVSNGQESSLPATATVVIDVPPVAGITLLDLATNGDPTSTGTEFALSADGRYVAFISTPTGFYTIPPQWFQTYVRDRVTGTLELVSVTLSGTQVQGFTGHPAITWDGRQVAFDSTAGGLVPGDLTVGGWYDVYLRDRQAGVTTLISQDPSGQPVDGLTHTASLGATAREVAFVSDSPNLVPGDTNAHLDGFVRDLGTGSTARFTVASSGTEGDGDSGGGGAAMSADGRFVCFSSNATNLVPGDTNGAYDIFVRDRWTGETTRVSVASDGTEADAESSYSAISADGRYVAFTSLAGNLVPGDTNGAYDIFVHDRLTGTTTLASGGLDGAPAGTTMYAMPYISANGRFVVFISASGNLVAGDTNGLMDVFVHDQITGDTALVSASTTSMPGDGDSGMYGYTRISPDGRFVVFESMADNLVPGDGDGARDAFLAANPLSHYDPAADDDGDGLVNQEEFTETFTFAWKADSDGDGVNDKAEVNAGTDPLDPTDF